MQDSKIVNNKFVKISSHGGGCFPARCGRLGVLFHLAATRPQRKIRFFKAIKSEYFDDVVRLFI